MISLDEVDEEFERLGGILGSSSVLEGGVTFASEVCMGSVGGAPPVFPSPGGSEDELDELDILRVVDNYQF